MERVAELTAFSARQTRHGLDATTDALYARHRATHGPCIEHEAVARVVAKHAARDVDSEQAAVGRNARQTRQRLRKGAASRRRAEVTADRMCQHDSMEFAPAIV